VCSAAGGNIAALNFHNPDHFISHGRRLPQRKRGNIFRRAGVDSDRVIFLNGVGHGFFHGYHGLVAHFSLGKTGLSGGIHIYGTGVVPKAHGNRRSPDHAQKSSRKEVLARVQYRMIPAAAAIKEQFGGTGLQPPRVLRGNQVNYLPVLFADIKYLNAVNGSPVGRLTSAFRVKDSFIEKRPGFIPGGPEFKNIGLIRKRGGVAIIYTFSFIHTKKV
jgi:hypothetical protein